ncbi:hypothetical protein [Lysobacter sp. P5_B9]
MLNIPIVQVLTLAIAANTAMVAPASEPKITFNSYGPVLIGMDRQALERALGSKLKGEEPDADSEACEYVAPERGYDGVGFMLINQHLARVDVSNPNVATLSGAHVGSTQESVLAMYPGRVEVSPHAYTAPDGSYLTLFSRDKLHGIRFETDHGKVTRYYSGTAEAIQYIEGCQ